MEEIEKRLRENTDACIKSFENWVKQAKNAESRETLMEAMHEVRKVLARVEIEIAISERDHLGSRQIPIPPHRSSRKREGGEDIESGSEEDFNMSEPSGQGDHQPRRQQHHGRNRRPMHGGGNRGHNNNNSGNGDNQPQ